MFGNLCFASTLTFHRNKFSPRAKACVFVGYSPGIKGYKVYGIVSKHFFFSRDLIFHETIFPFHTVSISSDIASDPFSDLVLPKPLHDIFPSVSGSTTPIMSSTDLTITSSHLGCDPYSSASETSTHSPNDLPLSPANQSIPHLRRSTRVPKTPSYLQDFHCNLLTNSPVPPTNSIYPITSFLSYSSFSPSHASFLCNIYSTFEPRFYHQAVKFDHWRDAMAKELEAMELNNTWTVLPLPKGKHAIGCKCMYRVKYKSNGSIERYKARLVAKGYTQHEGAWIL